MTSVKLGNIGSKEQAERIVSKLQGQTFYNFQVQYANYMGNYPVTVLTDDPNAEESDLMEMVMFVMAKEL